MAMPKPTADGIHMQQRTEEKWGYFNGDLTCACGMAAENTAHMLRCSVLSHHCTLDDRLKFNDIGKECAEQ